jgi:tetratricopeptide (TPR) repeat protein
MAVKNTKKGPKAASASAKPEKLDYQHCVRKIAELENTFKKTQKPGLLTQIGELYFSIGSLEPAFAFFTKASTLEPGNYKNYKGIADCLVITQRPAEAIEYYRMALNLSPETEIVRTSYGHTLMHLKKYE